MNYLVLCYEPNCGREALYKIAARWSDGIIQELKTYSLCCERCLEKQFASSWQRFPRTQMLEQETLEPPGIYRLSEGWRDRQLLRLKDLEEKLLALQSSDKSGKN